ncbi:MAG: hypothetical protein L6Q84_33450 [Polyangiaceae bacterium]|nr:hypothetical protein [Polyangiaceae bacterium]
MLVARPEQQRDAVGQMLEAAGGLGQRGPQRGLGSAVSAARSGLGPRPDEGQVVPVAAKDVVGQPRDQEAHQLVAGREGARTLQRSQALHAVHELIVLRGVGAERIFGQAVLDQGALFGGEVITNVVAELVEDPGR